MALPYTERRRSNQLECVLIINNLGNLESKCNFIPVTLDQKIKVHNILLWGGTANPRSAVNNTFQSLFMWALHYECTLIELI